MASCSEQPPLLFPGVVVVTWIKLVWAAAGRAMPNDASRIAASAVHWPILARDRAVRDVRREKVNKLSKLSVSRDRTRLMARSWVWRLFLCRRVLRLWEIPRMVSGSGFALNSQHLFAALIFH